LEEGAAVEIEVDEDALTKAIEVGEVKFRTSGGFRVDRKKVQANKAVSVGHRVPRSVSRGQARQIPGFLAGIWVVSGHLYIIYIKNSWEQIHFFYT
jgi:hypothetical protein